MKAEEFVELGFNKRMATILSLLDEITNHAQCRQNVELLKQCVDLNTLKEPLSGIFIFLTREYETNLFMMSVPEKYGFTPQERKKYLSNPFNWEYECDLKEELDEQLQQIFTDEEKRMSIYRKLYLKGAWQACSVIRSSCQTMLEIADNAEEVEKLISKTPSFFFREGTIRYIRALQAHFKPEAVWKIFKAHVLYIAEFDDPVYELGQSPFLEHKDEVFERIKKEHLEDTMKKEGEENNG